MPLVNHNNGVLITATGSYCPITVPPPPTTVTLTTGSPCRVIETIGWMIVGNATAAGTVNIQFQDPLDLTFRTPNTPPTPFPITIAASGVYMGNVPVIAHGAQLAITLTAGGLTVCELIGELSEYEE